MRKLIFTGIVLIPMFFVLSVFAFNPCSQEGWQCTPAPNTQPCAPIWDNVEGNTYTLTLDAEVFTIVFLDSMCGPCPQGIVEIYNSEEEYLGKCKYVSTDQITIRLTCGDSFLDFVFSNDKLFYLSPDALTLKKQIKED